MIVGGGMLARAFAPRLGSRPDILVFASGVSNSLEISTASFEREQRLLAEHLSDKGRRVVYFSSCGVIDDDARLTPYMKHKKRMESLVLVSPGGMVFRLPQVVGPTENAHTLTNFLRDRILSGEHFSVWAKAQRNLIDIDDIVDIGTSIIDESLAGSRVFSIAATQSLDMLDIVKIFELTLGKAAHYSIEDKGLPMTIDTGKAEEVAARLRIKLGNGYIENVIKKYYTPK